MKSNLEPPAAEDPRQRLVEAAISEIELHGMSKLTVRAVATRAGANIAAVNYYFRSKDALVLAALEGSIRHMVADSEALLSRMAEAPERVLTELLHYYLEGALRYPRISKAQLFDAFSRDYSGPFPTLFAPVMERLRAAIRDAVPGLSEREASRRVVTALSAVFFPAFFAGLFSSLSTLRTRQDRQLYAEEIAHQALAACRSRDRKK